MPRFRTAPFAALVVSSTLILCGLPGAPLPPARSAPATPAAAPRAPSVTRTRLANGLVVLILPDARSSRIQLRFVARAGSANDPPGGAGTAALVAAMLDRGAGSRDAARIASDLSASGAVLGTEVDAERLTVRCSVPKNGFAATFDLLRDLVTSPAFPDSGFVLVRDEALATIARSADDPAALAARALPRFVFGDGPLGHPAAGWDSTVRAIRRDDLVAFHRRLVTPENSILVVVGDVAPTGLLAKIQSAFAGWPAGAAPAGLPYAPVPRIGVRHVAVVGTAGLDRAEIRIACPGVARTHPDESPIEVANEILGGGPASRLARELRGTPALADSAASSFSMLRNAGTFTIGVSTRPATLRSALDAVLRAAGDVVRNGPASDELEAARRSLLERHARRLATPEGMAAELADLEFHGLAPGDRAAWESGIRAVTLEDVRRALKSYVCVDDAGILIVADPDAATAALAGLGPVERLELP